MAIGAARERRGLRGVASERDNRRYESVREGGRGRCAGGLARSKRLATRAFQSGPCYGRKMVCTSSKRGSRRVSAEPPKHRSLPPSRGKIQTSHLRRPRGLKEIL